MLQKVTFVSMEKKWERRNIIDTILRFYAVNSVIEKHYTDDSITWTFNIRKRDMNDLEQDVRTLRICEFSIKRTEL